MRKNNHKNAPFPEIVSGKAGWKIFEDAKAPRTSNLSKEMHVPLDGDCVFCGINHSKMIRRHELGHVKWSPQTIGKLKDNEDSQSVEVCEEVRVNYLLSVKGLPIDKPMMCEDTWAKKCIEAIYEYSEYDLICFLLAAMWWVNPGSDTRWVWNRSADNEEFKNFLNIYTDICDDNVVSHADRLTKLRKMQIDWALNKAREIYKIILATRGSYQQVVSYQKVRKGAKVLASLRDDFGEQPKPEEVYQQLKERADKLKQQKQNQMSVKDMKQQAAEEGEQTLAESELETKQQMSNLLAGSDMNYNPDENNMTGRWGKMDIYTPDLSVNLQGKIKGGREYRPMDYGVNPKYMNRWCIDKKVFKQRQRTYGGTILIDASGSMRFSGDDILEIMQLLPAVTVAMYNSSNNRERWSHDTGSLRIIGAKGKRVNEDYLQKWSGGGNLVDGPALRWLSKQAPARIWVSDMYVFGADNTSAANLLKECNQIMVRSGITRLADIDDVKRFALELNQL